jgi:hypothetical protein
MALALGLHNLYSPPKVKVAFTKYTLSRCQGIHILPKAN